jgi:hypothetical protein
MFGSYYKKVVSNASGFHLNNCYSVKDNTKSATWKPK